MLAPSTKNGRRSVEEGLHVAEIDHRRVHFDLAEVGLTVASRVRLLPMPSLRSPPTPGAQLGAVVEWIAGLVGQCICPRGHVGQNLEPRRRRHGSMPTRSMNRETKPLPLLGGDDQVVALVLPGDLPLEVDAPAVGPSAAESAAGSTGSASRRSSRASPRGSLASHTPSQLSLVPVVVVTACRRRGCRRR